MLAPTGLLIGPGLSSAASESASNSREVLLSPSVGTVPLSSQEPNNPSNTWAGFVYCSNDLGPPPSYCNGNGNVEGVSGCWNVPQVMFNGVSADERADTWIGIGGNTGSSDNNLIQIGTEENPLTAPLESPFAWVETNPDNVQSIQNLFSVAYGDQVCASIQYLGLTNGGQQAWSIFIQDLTNGQSQNVATWPYPYLVCGLPGGFYSLLCEPSDFTSAEWIMETPKSSSTGTYTSMPVFKQFQFSDLAAYVKSEQGSGGYEWSSAQWITDHSNSEDLYLQSVVGSTNEYTVAEAEGPQDGIGNAVVVEYAAYLASQTFLPFGDVSSHSTTGTISTRFTCSMSGDCPTWLNGPFDLAFVVQGFYGPDCFPPFCDYVSTYTMPLKELETISFTVPLPLPTSPSAGTYWIRVCLSWEGQTLECLGFQKYVLNPDLMGPTISVNPTTAEEGRTLLDFSISSWPSQGSSPYSYTWEVPSKLGCAPQAGSDSGLWDCTPAVGSGTPSGTFYTVGLKVCDQMAECATSTVLFIVYAILTISISATPSSGSSPLSVSFASSVLSGSGNYQYSWTFGDGGTSTAANPSHTYSCSSGCTYIASLTVTDQNTGHTASASAIIVVGFFAHPIITTESGIYSPVKVQFAGSATGGSGNYGWSWTFGDGYGSTAQNPTHTYYCSGTGVCHYTSTLTVTDHSTGEQASASVSVGICGSNGCGIGCVPYGTLISTPTGAVPVQLLSPGSTVWGYDTSTGQSLSGTVVGNNVSVTQSLLDVNNGGIKLTLTDQPIYMRNSSFEGWLWNPSDLTVGDYLFEPLSSQWILVRSLSIMNQSVRIYDLQVNDAHDYVANNFLLLDKIAVLTNTKLLTSPLSIDLGQAVSFTLQGAVAPNATIYWYGLPTGCSGHNSTFLSCVPTGAGSFEVNVSTVSPDGLTLGSASLHYTVFPNLTVQMPTGRPLSGDLDAGQTATFSVNVSGGAGGYQFDWSGLPPGCFPLDSATITCTPAQSGSYAINANVTDSNSVTAESPYANYAVNSDPTILALSEQPGSIVLGQSVNFTAFIMGGSGGYLYTWSGLPPGCSSTNSNQVQCTPTSPGTFDVGINVTDSNGFSARGLHSVFTVFMESALILVNMTGTPKNGVNVVLTDNGSIVVNESITRTAGPPDVLALSNLYFKVGHIYYLVLTYEPDTKNQKSHGDNPAFVNVTFGGCTSGFTGLIHDFNAEHSTTYTWRINLSQVFGCQDPAIPPSPPAPPPPKVSPPGATSFDQSDSSVGGGTLSPEMFALFTTAIATIQCAVVVLYITHVWLPRKQRKAATPLYGSKEQE